ncbi:hypothetical protein Tco_0505037 [Tanacetum coccineum]
MSTPGGVRLGLEGQAWPGRGGGAVSLVAGGGLVLGGKKLGAVSVGGTDASRELGRCLGGGWSLGGGWRKSGNGKMVDTSMWEAHGGWETVWFGGLEGKTSIPLDQMPVGRKGWLGLCDDSARMHSHRLKSNYEAMRGRGLEVALRRGFESEGGGSRQDLWSRHFVVRFKV